MHRDPAARTSADTRGGTRPQHDHPPPRRAQQIVQLRGMMSTTGNQSGRDIDTAQIEERRFPPPPDLAAAANAGPETYERGFEEFWETGPGSGSAGSATSARCWNGSRPMPPGIWAAR
jgi:hypothetical protein